MSHLHYPYPDHRHCKLIGLANRNYPLKASSTHAVASPLVQPYGKICTQLLLVLLLAVNAGCNDVRAPNSNATQSPTLNSSPAKVDVSTVPETNKATKPEPSHEYAHQILISGDSLSAAYGIPLKQGWVSLLEKRLHNEGYDYQVVNTSISGETTAGALKRLQQDLDRYQPEIVVIELGANDGLRGTPLKAIHSNLQKIINLCQTIDADIVMLAMQIPPNYGARYSEQFNQNYHRLAKSNELSLVPFFWLT